ncbi:MAG: EAL domain-containing protein, partial [Gammaproteobacteria bacterium]|nr:EAL domain-containing protein [Gammaproteobacteria bacterium]
IDTSAVMASKILGTLDRPFEIEGHTLQVGGSVGIVMFPEHGEHIDTLIQRADIAMYGAKKQKIGFVVYDPETDQHSMRSLALVGELRHAIENEELILHYHPKIDLKTNECVGVEALVRWEHKERGLLMPDLFIPIAERTGLIATLSQWVLENAMDQIATLNQNGFELDVSINLSAQDIQDPLLPEQIQKLIRKTGIDSSNVVLEITESTLMTDVQKAMEILSLLKKMGLKLAIDDFGTGYSSLEYLKKLSVHELKIDKSFVCEMSTDENDAVIVRSIIDLAHNLGLNVVAEGVENRDSLDLLEMLSCDTVQGFYFTKPLDLESLLKFLSARKWDKGKRTVSRAS